MGRVAPAVRPVGINTGMTMTGIEIYHLLARRKLTWSRRDASVFLLGKNPSYLAQCGDRPLPNGALVHLFRHLWATGHIVMAARIGWLILWGSSPRGDQT